MEPGHKGTAIFFYNLQELPAQESMVTLPIEKMMHQPQEQEALLACKPHKGRGHGVLCSLAHLIYGSGWLFGMWEVLNR